MTPKCKQRVPVMRRPSDWNLIDKRFQYTNSSRVSLCKRWRSETSQKAIKINWRVINKSCTNCKSVQQVLTFIPWFHSSRLFRHENCTISEVNWKKIEWKCMYLVQAETAIYCRRHLCSRQVPLEPCLMRSFFLKAFHTQSSRAHKSRVRVTGGIGKLSIRISQLKAAEDSSSACKLPLNCYLPSQRGNKKGRFCLLKLQTFDKEKPLSVPCAHLTGKRLGQPHLHTRAPASPPLTCPAALRQLCKTQEFQVLQWNKYIGQPYVSFCLLCYTARAGKKPFRQTAAVTAIHCR